MRTFEFNDGKSKKFWNIELEGASFTVTYGRIGATGQTQTKDFSSDSKAQAAYDKLVAEKLGKGYVETIAGPAATAAPTTSSGKALENAIFANPDDLGAHAAYADWLFEQGDPRGEFIQVQLALEDPNKSAKERKDLQKREKELLDKHQREWLGDLAPRFLDHGELDQWRRDRGYFSTCHFARGWLDSVRIVGLNVAVSRALAKSPQARIVRRLEIVSTDYEEAGEYESGDDIPEETRNPTLYPLLKSSNFSNVRIFQLGDKEVQCHTEGEVAADLIRKMPRIEEIYLLAHRVDAKTLFGLKKLQNLRILQIDHLNFAYPLGVLAKNPVLGKLAQITIHPHALEPGEDEGYINLAGVKALVNSPHLKSLTHLQLRLNDMGDKGCKEFVTSGILKRLKMLDIMGGCVTDKGAKMLADCLDLRNLELLVISKNRLTAAGIGALKKSKINFKAEEQYPALEEGEEDDEREYLWEGDME